MLNGSSCGTTAAASTTYGFGFHLEDHQFFVNGNGNVGGAVPRRVSPAFTTSSSPSALSNEACKIEYQLYGNVHMGSSGTNGAGRLTPSMARMEPVSAN